MKLLMSPAEVADAAFGGKENVPPDILNDTAVLAAQYKFIRPVLGGLYDALLGGKYTDLLDSHIKPALAEYTKLTVLPALSAQVGVLGVVQYGGAGFDSAGEKALQRLSRRVRDNAETLMRSAVDHIEALPSSYPEYEAKDNVKNRVSIDGGVVL